MRRFSSEYLRRTRRGMWSDDRSALDGLRLDEISSVLDVGCGDGALTCVLLEECDEDTEVVGCDADTALLRKNPASCVRGDAHALPFRDSSFELMTCQALLVNLPEPERAVEEFVRVASERVACVEPDNSAVRVESTVRDEEDVARRSRNLYLEGVGTEVSLGADAADLLREAGLKDVTVARYDHTTVVEPPYSEDDVEAVKRKASGEAFSERRGEMAGDEDALDALRDDWRAVGREAAMQMREGEYRRTETVPFYVVVGEL
ncbi:MAG: methyltransferase domain-containing protein [Halobacteriales archaeon]|nr:methyltransferase domain-containing protein [Halobacteriales archaeon]